MTKQNAVDAARKRLAKCGVDSVCTDMLSHYRDNLIDEEYDNCVNSLIDDSLYWSGKFMPVNQYS